MGLETCAWDMHLGIGSGRPLASDIQLWIVVLWSSACLICSSENLVIGLGESSGEAWENRMVHCTFKPCRYLGKNPSM